mgnify:CR=1 FL=1
MTNRAVIHTKRAPEAIGTYSQAVKVDNTVYLSGQIPLIPDTMELVDGGFEAQAEQVFANLTGALRAAGAAWPDVVKMTGFMVGMNADNVAAYREARNRYVKQAELPASTLVGLERLVDPDLVLLGHRQQTPTQPRAT